jgi:hypothetical protein
MVSSLGLEPRTHALKEYSYTETEGVKSTERIHKAHSGTLGNRYWIRNSTQIFDTGKLTRAGMLASGARLTNSVGSKPTVRNGCVGFFVVCTHSALMMSPCERTRCVSLLWVTTGATFRRRHPRRFP